MSARSVVASVLALCGAAYAAWALAFASPYTLLVLSQAGIFAIAALGYQFIFGHAGALALSQGTFMGVGAYVAAILATRYGLAFDTTLGLSVAAPVVLAGLVALPVLRLRTHYFALATLVIAHLALLLATSWQSVTGGANGIGAIAGLSLLGHPVARGWPSLVLVWSAVALAALMQWGVMLGRRGRAFALLRAHPMAAECVGIDTARLRLMAFLLAAAYAGAAGALHARTVGVVSPDILGLPVTVTLLTIVVIGGRTRIAGAILGAVLVVLLPEWFRALRDVYLLVYGCILLLCVVAMPDGMVAAAERLVAVWWPDRRTAPIAAEPPPARAAAVPDRPVLLRVETIERHFGGVRALDGVSLEVRTGEVVGLVGPNGSGKTTLLDVVSGVTAAGSGRIALAGRDVTRLAPNRRAGLGMARTFQTSALVDDLTGAENVAVAGGGMREAAAYLAAADAAAATLRACAGLPDALRRRVELARALGSHPTLLLLDEPAAGLDEADKTRLARRLRALAGSGMAIIVVEHDLGFLAGACDRLVCLAAGRVIADGSPKAVRVDPGVIAAYTGHGSGEGAGV